MSRNKHTCISKKSPYFPKKSSKNKEKAYEFERRILNLRLTMAQTQISHTGSAQPDP